MQRCPNCRARYRDGDACRRCGMELGHLLAVEAAAERLLRQGVASLVNADAPAAVDVLQRATSLAHDPFTELLLGLARHQAVEGSYSGDPTPLQKESSSASPDSGPQVG